MNQMASCRSQTARASSAGWDLVCASSHSLCHVSLGDYIYTTIASKAAKHTEVVECIVAPIRALVGRRRRGFGQHLHFRSLIRQSKPPPRCSTLHGCELDDW